MFSTQVLAPARKAFTDQFESNGMDFTYRKDMKGAPIKISAAEREKFITKYDKVTKRGYWFMTAALLMYLLLLVTYSVWANINVPTTAVWLGIIAFAGIAFAGLKWAKSIPDKAIVGRIPVGEARSRDEIRRLIFSRMTYWQMAFAVAIAAWWALRTGWRDHFQSATDWLWLAFASAIVVAAAIQSFRKWHFESTHK
jgi:hypothetical protein